ncbi:MAG: tetratricopeptide repeat protein [Acidobacteriota bacterium]
MDTTEPVPSADLARHRRIAQIVAEALERHADERYAFLDQACGDDLEMRAEVEDLLDQATEDLEDPTQSTDVFAYLEQSFQEPADAYPSEIGNYRIVEPLGSGGMGAVFLAEQSQPVKRQVALKLMHASLRSPRALGRFEAERNALARIAHPNVAQLYEAGTTDDGFPFFAMEHIPQGEPITRFCDAEKLSIEDRLELFIAVCRGVHSAHQKGVLHRDLKPGNVLVTKLEDGRAIPKVIDFGLAKAIGDLRLTDETQLTALHAIGTPAYMSPEARLAVQDVDTRSDVYSLGVMLFELLTGVRPSDGEGGSREESVKQRRPSNRVTRLDGEQSRDIAAERRLEQRELPKRLRGDLDWIVVKALADEPERRYASAAELAADLQRHLDAEPIIARPPSAGYRFGKFFQRHRVAAVAATLVLAALVGGFIATSLALVRARQAEAEARRSQTESQQVSEFLTGLFQVSDPGRERGSEVTARELLDEGAARIREDLDDQPLVQARLMRTIGDVYVRLGLYEPASTILTDAVGVLRNLPDPPRLELAETLQSLGYSHEKQADLETAEAEIRRSLEMLTGDDRDSGLLRAEGHRILGVIFNSAGRYEQAVEQFRLALDLWRQLAVDDLEIAKELSNLGLAELRLGQYPQAQSRLEESVARWQASGGDEFLSANAWTNLGLAHYRQRHLDEALAAHRRALTIREKWLEDDHPDLAGSLYSVGTMLAETGDHAGALDHIGRATGILEATLGSQHPNVAAAYEGMAVMNHSYLGDLDAAERLYRKVLTIREAIAPGHPDLAATLRRLGDVYVQRQSYGQARPILERSLRIRRAALDADHPHIAESLGALGSLDLATGRLPQAETALRQALAIHEAKSSPEDPEFGLTVLNLARVLTQNGTPGEARPLYDRAIEMMADIEPLEGELAEAQQEREALR